jgi:hypothetical protein
MHGLVSRACQLEVRREHVEACASSVVMRSEHVSGQTDNGACGDLVCETGALRLCVVVLVHIFFGAHRSDHQAPARSLRAGPAISVLAPCAVQPLPSFWCLHLPSRGSALILSSRCCPFLSNPNTGFCPDVRFPTPSLIIIHLLICVAASHSL